jgi:phosphate/sulfate permease
MVGMGESREHPVATKWRKRIAIFLILSSIVGLIGTPVLFFLGYINDTLFIHGIVGSIGGFLVAFIIYRMPTGRFRYEPNRARTLTRISFIFLGAFFGGIIAFFAAGYLLIEILGGPIPGGPLGNAFLIFAWIVAPIIGGFIGYLIFRRSKYSDLSLYSVYA